MIGKSKPVVLMGPAADDPAESVSAVNAALATGLADRYEFVLSATTRRHGSARQSEWNGWNLWYLVKHVLVWCFNLLRHRPVIAHYAVSSGPALEKSLLMLAMARLAGARTVGHLHSGGFIDCWKRLSPIRRRLALRGLRKLDAFVVLSERWRDRMEKEVGLDPAKLRVVNNPISLDFEREALAMPLRRPSSRVLTIGTLGKDKGVIELIDACARIAPDFPDFALDVAGPEREPGIQARVVERLRTSGLDTRVALLGTVHGGEKLELFREASIFVLPSHYENFPLVVLEAAAAGLAIITTPVGAVPEFFEHGESALFVQPGDPDELAAAMAWLLAEPDERQRLAEGARSAFLKRLSRNLITGSLDAVYRELIGHRDRGFSRTPAAREAAGSLEST